MGSILALLITNLPTILQVAQDVTIVVNGLKAGDSVFEAIKSSFPAVSDAVQEIAKVFPNAPGVSEAEHLDSIAKALFAEFTWSPEQLAVLKPFLPANTGGGSLGFNQDADAGDA